MVKWVLGVHEKTNIFFCDDTGGKPYVLSVLCQYIRYFERVSTVPTDPTEASMSVHQECRENKELNLT